MFNLVSETNETRRTEQHEMSKYKCRINSSACNNKQHWNEDKCSVNAKNWLIKVYAIKDLFGILETVSVNVINPVILVSI